ncbi:hypothetical protein LXL04_017665 [Taraxacum kok-saghyz]
MMHLINKFEHLKIHLEALKSATNNFSAENCIGRGGFGKVYKGELVHSKEKVVVALKRLDPRFGQGNPEFWMEILMLSLHKHENIISLLGFCDENNEKILVYEYASRRSLDAYLDHDDLTWIRRLKICIGAARGIAYLHNPGETQQRVLHRDIKSSNILLDENWNAKIADLGLSKFGPANQRYTFLVTNTVGTLGYCDPVYIETGLLTKESDVYSFGVVLFEVLCGRLSISNNNGSTESLIGLVRQYYPQNKISDIIYSNMKEGMNPKSLDIFIQIAYRCLMRDIEKRPLMSDVVSILESALEYQLGFDSFKVTHIPNQYSSSYDEINASQEKSGPNVNPSNPGYCTTLIGNPFAVPALQVDELKEITDNFNSMSLIGEGVYGGVYFGVLRSGQAAAIKNLDSKKQPDQDFVAQVSMVSRLEHKNVVKLLGYCIEGDWRILAYEFASMGSLHDLLYGKTNFETSLVLSWSQRVKIAIGAAKGIEYLHDEANPPTVHRDVTSRNVLIFDKDVAKIADFDLFKQVPVQELGRPSTMTRVLSIPRTLGYHAPEYIMEGKLTSKSDVYSFGVVLLELLTGRMPIDYTMPRGQQSLVTWARPRLGADKVKQCVDPRLYGEYLPEGVAKMASIASSCLKYEDHLRPDMRTVVKSLEPLLNASE